MITTFTKTASNERCQFLGNVTVGEDVSLAQLRKHYTAVVLVSSSTYFFTLYTQEQPRNHYVFRSSWLLNLHIDGLVQKRHNSSALAMELHLSCTNPLISYIYSCFPCWWCSQNIPGRLNDYWWLGFLCCQLISNNVIYYMINRSLSFIWFQKFAPFQCWEMMGILNIYFSMCFKINSAWQGLKWLMMNWWRYDPEQQ